MAFEISFQLKKYFESIEIVAPMSDSDNAIRLIKTKSADIRSKSDLNLITATFDADLNADAVWASLSRKHKNLLCKHFEFRAALSDDGDLYSCVEQTGVE